MPAGIYPRTPLAQRFWAKVDKSGDCWLWTGARSGGGYGKIGVGGRVVDAHRVAWELEGGPIPPGSCVMHSCDTPPCVRVSHLSLGTHKENMADAVAKGRVRRGEAGGQAKLTQIQVDALRDTYRLGGVTFKALGDRYGISASQAFRIVRGKRWTHGVFHHD